MPCSGRSLKHCRPPCLPQPSLRALVARISPYCSIGLLYAVLPSSPKQYKGHPAAFEITFRGGRQWAIAEMKAEDSLTLLLDRADMRAYDAKTNVRDQMCPKPEGHVSGN